MTLDYGAPEVYTVPSLRTPRLVLRGWRATDIGPYLKVSSHPDMAAHTPSPTTEAAVWSQTAFQIGHWAVNGFGMWVVEDRTTGQVLGRAGLYEAPGWPGLEVAWTIRRDRWGQGLATEAGAAALEYAFTVVGRDQIISIMTSVNVGSIQVAEKLGLTFDRTERIQNGEYSIYAITREQWEKRPQARLTEDETAVVVGSEPDPD